MHWANSKLLQPEISGKLRHGATDGSGQLPTDGLHNVRIILNFVENQCRRSASLVTQYPWEVREVHLQNLHVQVTIILTERGCQVVCSWLMAGFV